MLVLLGLLDVSGVLVLDASLLLLFFFFFFLLVSSVDVALLWSVLVLDVPLMSLLELPLVEPADDPVLPLCGGVDDDEPDCCAIAIPTENRAAVAIARSFFDIV